MADDDMPRTRQQLTIANIIGNDRTGRVFLSDGSELIGLTRMVYSLAADDVPRIELTARVIVPPGKEERDGEPR